MTILQRFKVWALKQRDLWEECAVITGIVVGAAVIGIGIILSSVGVMLLGGAIAALGVAVAWHV